MKEALTMMRAEQDPRQRIKVAVTSSVDYLLDSADMISVLRREVAGSRDLMQHEFKEFSLEYIQLLADAIRRGTEQGIFRPVEPVAAARVLLTMIQGTFAMVYMSGIRNQTNGHSASAILDIFFHGIDA
jgi:hypothetical protein